VETQAYIALGSNIGDREMNLLAAVAEIGKLPHSRVTALSPFYETSPVGVLDQRAFFNACLRLSTELEALELLAGLQEIETRLGRTRTTRWGPRKIDLDLLLYGNSIIGTEELTIPHPRMAERLFVLQPLYDIAPDLVHPVLCLPISRLLEGLESNEKVTRI